MASPQWHDRFRAELGRQGLPPAYISRLVEELYDHVADSASEDSSVDVDISARLGTPRQLAAIAKAEYQRRTFAGRHPFLTFIAGPTLAVIVTVAVVSLIADMALACWGLLDAPSDHVAAHDDVGSAAVEAAIVHVFHSLVRFLPFALPAWFFVRLGRRAEMPVWSTGACGFLAFIAISFFSVLMPAKDPACTRWVIGFDAATGYGEKIARGGEIGWGRLLQAAAPLALAAWAIWCHVHGSVRHRRAVARQWAASHSSAGA